MRLSHWLGKTSPPRTPTGRSLSTWLDGKDLDRGNMAIAAPNSFQTEILKDALRSKAPGQWFSDKLKLSQEMRGLVYLAVNVLATQFSFARPVLYRHTDDEFDEDGKERLSRYDPMYSLVRHPNPLETWADVAYQMSMQLDTTGLCRIWMPSEDDNPAAALGFNGYEPTEMYVIPTATALPLPRSAQYPDGAYRVIPYYNTAFFSVAPNYNAGAGAIIPGGQVITIQNYHPLIRWEGYAVLSAIARSVDTINAIDESRWAAMMQGCEQTIALELDPATKNPDAADLRRIREEWQRIYSGAKNAGKIVVTPPGAKINQFATEPEHMAYEEGWSQLADFILACYGVPKAILMSGDLNYATLFASLRQFSWLSLDPRCWKYGQGLTKHWIGPTYGDEYLLELQGKPIDDKQLTQQMVANAQKSGSLTHQELRRLNGWGDLDPKEHPWVLERAFAGTGQEPAAADADQERDPEVEASRPENNLGDGSLGPRGKGMHAYLAEQGDRLAEALEKYKTRGLILNGANHD